MQSDKRNTRVKYIVLCALAAVSMAAIAGDRTGISVYGYGADRGYQRQFYAGDNGVFRHRLTKILATSPTEDFITAASRAVPYQEHYEQTHPYYSPSPYGGYQPSYNRGYSEGYHDGYHQGQHHPSKPRHGTSFGNRH